MTSLASAGVTTVVGRPDPFTVVVKEGIRLGVYAAGGLNVSIGELSRIFTADVFVGKASGFAGVSGVPYEFHVTSGSGNIATISAFWKGSAAEVPVISLSSFPLTIVAYGA